MLVRKGVIPAAGFGTGLLPASKAVPKNLIPIVDRPMMQFAVEELARAGISNVCIVISQGTEGVADHFTVDRKLESVLERAGKKRLLDGIRRLSSIAEIYYVYQHEPLGLGHAVGVAREHIGDEPFVVLLPDELFDPARNFVKEMLELYEETGRSSVCVLETPIEEIGKYGVVDPIDSSEDPIRVRAVVEKPDPGLAPSNLAIAGRYVLVPDVFEIIAKLDPGALGEIQLTDALGILAERGELLAKVYDGRRWDVGQQKGLLQAVVAMAAEHEELGPEFRRFLRDFVTHVEE